MHIVIQGHLFAQAPLGAWIGKALLYPKGRVWRVHGHALDTKN